MSNSVTLSATVARSSFFELLDAARHNGQTTHILKNGKVVASLVPPVAVGFDWEAHLADLQRQRFVLSAADEKKLASHHTTMLKPRQKSW